MLALSVSLLALAPLVLNPPSLLALAPALVLALALALALASLVLVLVPVLACCSPQTTLFNLSSKSENGYPIVDIPIPLFKNCFFLSAPFPDELAGLESGTAGVTGSAWVVVDVVRLPVEEAMD